jgi:hypothetical protein
VGETIEIKGVIGQTFVATIDGGLVELPINVETKCGIITKILPGATCGREYSYMIKFMCYQFPIQVEEDYIVHQKCC